MEDKVEGARGKGGESGEEWGAWKEEGGRIVGVGGDGAEERRNCGRCHLPVVKKKTVWCLFFFNKSSISPYFRWGK